MSFNLLIDESDVTSRRRRQGPRFPYAAFSGRATCVWHPPAETTPSVPRRTIRLPDRQQRRWSVASRPKLGFPTLGTVPPRPRSRREMRRDLEVGHGTMPAPLEGAL